jgi:hypothetical protein
MAVPQLQVSPQSFNVSPEGPEDGQFVSRRDLPTGQPAHLESALPPELARRVVEEALSLTRPMRCRLTVEGGGDPVSLDLPLKYDPEAAPDFRLRTPDGAQGVEFVLNARPDGQATFNLDVRYAGLPVGRALSYVRFLRALYREEGTLYLTRLEPEELKLELLELPLPLDPAGKGETENRLRFLEALEEIGRATGAEFVYPSEVDNEDLRNLNHVLKAIRGGWVAQRVTDFTTPMGPEGVKNVLDITSREGEVLRALAMTAEWERVNIFDTWVDLGPSTRYVSAARLQTSRAEMEEWSASEPKQGDSFEIRWAPEDGALVHVFYHEWPKPSLDVVRRNLEAFENEYGMSSDEFRRAWDNGEPHARDIEDGDIWISFLEAQETLEPGA